MKRIHPKPRLLCLLVVMMFAMAGRAQTGLLEYWFDTNFDPKTISFSGSEASVETEIDVQHLTQGFHSLCMRVKRSDGVYSPVTTSMFIKFDASGESMIEYWFDDKFDMRQAMSVDLGQEGTMKLELDMLNDAKFPLGLHQLNMRVAANGSQYSPIYSAYVMKLASGVKDEISYWFDDDYENRKVLTGLPSQNGQKVFIKDLELSTVSMGMHMLKMRVASNGFDDGIIYQFPVINTRLYCNDDNVTIDATSFWADSNISDSYVSISANQAVYTHKFELNPDDYETGSHVYYVKYRNSSGVWSSPNATYFYKDSSSGKLRAGMLADAVESVNADADVPVYSLHGIKVGMSSDMKQLPQGLYIVGGKKVLVK